MSWQTELQLCDLSDSQWVEARCRRCGHIWAASPERLRQTAAHMRVYLDEIAESLMCTRPGCGHCGAHIALIRGDDTSGFVGGMP